MLILVAVAVRTAVNSGLFGHAKNATEAWADAQRNELAMDQQVGDLIDQYTGAKEHNWKRNGDNIHCDHCNLSFVIGDYVDYKPDATSKTVSVTEEECGVNETTEMASNLNNSVTLASLNNTNNSARIQKVSTIGTQEFTQDSTTYWQVLGVEDSDKIGTQEFTQDSTTYWQVLGVEDSDKNGTNETLLIKMAGGTSQTLYLRGAAAYNNGPSIMNRISKELYSSSKYGEARSINITDVNNTLQYTPGGGFYYNSGTGTDPVSLTNPNGATITRTANNNLIDGKVIKTLSAPTIYETNGFNTKVQDLPTWDTVKGNGTYTPDGTNTEAKLGSYTVDGYFYSMNNDGTGVTNPATGVTTNITEATRDIIFFDPTKTDTIIYWLACRGVLVDAGVAYFGPGAVGDGVAYSYGFTFGSGGGRGDGGFPVCPVVSLRSEIPAKIATPNFESTEV